MAEEYMLDWLISVDDHVLEPPDLWQNRVPSQLRDRAPKIVRDGDNEWWEYDGIRSPTTGLAATAGKEAKDFSFQPMRYEDMRPGCYDSVARTKDMDEAGILASLCFPSFPRFCGQVFTEGKDRGLGLICVQAYNDWMIEEWCGSVPGRFIPNIILPLWDPVLAAEEVRRCARKGARALAFSENPAALGLPSIYDPAQPWDPVWQACDETGVVVCMHIGSSSQFWRPSDKSPGIVNYILGAPVNISAAMIEWLFAPPFNRYPNLKIALSEGAIGWIPYYLERSAYTVERHRYWVNKVSAQSMGRAPTSLDALDPVDELEGLPDLETMDVRAVFRDHIFGCFINDFHGVANIRDIGIDNVMIETDYPHSDSTWPDCIKFAHEQLSTISLTNEEKYKILRGNAERVFRFDPAQPPVLERGHR
ncbi:MAG TPA: amidohydrolase family protein [Amycolatopsis sp.]|nr:amidohydrolase family protein [Amycolatopsis sp.]